MSKPIPNNHMVISIDVSSELDLMITAEQVYRDYLDILKSSVIPEITKAYNLKLREIRVLACAAQKDGHISASDISTELRQDPATITRSMVTLIGLGFVKTSESFSDGRSRVINLTDKGFEAVERYNSLVRNAITRATIIDETFISTDNLKSTKSIMTKLATRLSVLSKNLRSKSKGNK